MFVRHSIEEPTLTGRLSRAARSVAGVLATVWMALAFACTPSTPTTCERVRAEEQEFERLFEEFVNQEDVTQEQLDSLILDEIPFDLQVVLDDPATFTITADHPLRDVLPGTALGTDESIVNFLSGCWGRIETERPFDGDIDVVVAEAWRVDLRVPDLSSHIMTGVEGMPCTVDQRSIVQSFPEATLSREDERPVLETEDGRLLLTIENGRAGGLDAGGTLSLHEVGTIQASIAIGTEELLLFTVDGDYLVTAEVGFDPDEPSIEDLDFWVRFECQDLSGM